MKEFFILTINNKYARNISILQSFFRALANSIGISYHFFYLEVKNLNSNCKNNKSEAEIEIKLKDKMP